MERTIKESPLNSKVNPILIMARITVIIMERFPDRSSMKSSLSSDPLGIQNFLI